MSNLLQDSALWLGQQLQRSDVAGRAVIYSRDGKSSDAINATVAMHTYEYLDSDGLLTTAFLHDWTFVATGIVIDGTQITPRDGDVLTETLDGVSHTYHVLPTGKLPCVEWLDSAGTLLLVHTKRIG